MSFCAQISGTTQILGVFSQQLDLIQTESRLAAQGADVTFHLCWAVKVVRRTRRGLPRLQGGCTQQVSYREQRGSSFSGVLDEIEAFSQNIRLAHVQLRGGLRNRNTMIPDVWRTRNSRNICLRSSCLCECLPVRESLWCSILLRVKYLKKMCKNKQIITVYLSLPQGWETKWEFWFWFLKNL